MNKRRTKLLKNLKNSTFFSSSILPLISPPSKLERSGNNSEAENLLPESAQKTQELKTKNNNSTTTVSRTNSRTTRTRTLSTIRTMTGPRISPEIREKSKKSKIDRQNRRFREEQEHQWQEQLEQERRQHQQKQQRHRPLTIAGPFNNSTYSPPTPRTREEPFQYIISITKEVEQVISARKTPVNKVNQDNI
ncbi:hypothetical protein Glove_300g101 [Diversispora epigaea]|uniref:Uncharacterized protein n=1 Tax=Diversispora epigaea TaxID=1348612 RepID=A0A397HX86_9GLOM|nr:hypothetical protein Glove_300g101 [Diversispora epigaea]